MKPKILLITTSFIRWKGDKLSSFIYNFAESIGGKCEVHVLAPHSKGCKKKEHLGNLEVHRFVYAPKYLELFGSGISIVSVMKNNPLTILLIPPFLVSATIAIVKLQLRYKFEVIHVHWMIPFGPVVGFIRLFSKFRYIITSHGSDVFPFAGKESIVNAFIRWLHRNFTLPRVDWIVPVSNPLKEALLQMLPSIDQEKVAIISMGIDYQKFFNGQIISTLRSPLRIIFVGRLAEFKGVRYLIDAMDILKKQNIHFVLWIYGDGLLRKSLEDQVSILNLQKKVVFYGFVGHDELPKRMASADIFVGPSIITSLGETEGFGLVFLEAMASGLVVIGTSVGGISELISDRETGILVEEKNPDAIAEAIKLVIKDSKLRETIIQNSQIVSKKYDWHNIADRYLELYGF